MIYRHPFRGHGVPMHRLVACIRAGELAAKFNPGIAGTLLVAILVSKSLANLHDLKAANVPPTP